MPVCQPRPVEVPTFGFGQGCCNFSCLVILILIVLQFGKMGRKDCDKECDYEEDYEKDYDEECDYEEDKEYEHEHEHKSFGFDGIDNGILFIIAIFFLACCGCGRR